MYNFQSRERKFENDLKKIWTKRQRFYSIIEIENFATKDPWEYLTKTKKNYLKNYKFPKVTKPWLNLGWEIQNNSDLGMISSLSNRELRVECFKCSRSQASVETVFKRSEHRLRLKGFQDPAGFLHHGMRFRLET